MTLECHLLVSFDGMEFGEKDLVWSSVDFLPPILSCLPLAEFSQPRLSNSLTWHSHSSISVPSVPLFLLLSSPLICGFQEVNCAGAVRWNFELRAEFDKVWRGGCNSLPRVTIAPKKCFCISATILLLEYLLGQPTVMLKLHQDGEGREWWMEWWL